MEPWPVRRPRYPLAYRPTFFQENNLDRLSHSLTSSPSIQSGGVFSPTLPPSYAQSFHVEISPPTHTDPPLGTQNPRNQSSHVSLAHPEYAASFQASPLKSKELLSPPPVSLPEQSSQPPHPLLTPLDPYENHSTDSATGSHGSKQS